jgi:tetratricopeptide (TPR) repeat protein
MADVVEAVLKPKRPRQRQSRVPDADSPDPIEIAMRAIATGADQHGAARAVLEKHACLIDAQCARESEELKALRLRRFTRYGVLLLVSAVLVGIAALLYNASRSRVLVVEAFQVPAALDQRGLSGRVIGSRVLDRLAELQRQTESTRAESSYSNNWESDIQIAIPETGISVGEAWRYLRAWLGTETRVGGEVVQTATGLSITTRAGSLSGGTVEGPEADLDQLVQQAAESIYRVTQPYRFAISLPAERVAERLQILQLLVDHEDLLERKWAYSGLSVTYRSIGDLPRAIVAAQSAVALDPDMIPALGNLGLAQMQLGHEEAAIAAFRASAAAAADADPDEFDLRIVAANQSNSQAAVAMRTGDPMAALRHVQRNLNDGGSRSFRLGSYSYAFPATQMAHNHQQAARLAASADLNPTEMQTYNWPLQLAQMELTRALDLDDLPAAERAARELMRLADARVATARMASAFSEAAENARRRAVWPMVAAALARAGRIEEAVVLVRQTPLDCYECLRSRALIAAEARNLREAQHWFRRANDAAPSIPFTHVDEGRVWLKAGNLGRSLASFSEAHRRSPRFADPLKYWGDVLVRRGDYDGALRRYAMAAERAPRWGSLHLEQAVTLLRLGRREDARATLQAAASMDLSSAEAARLRQAIAAAN